MNIWGNKKAISLRWGNGIFQDFDGGISNLESLSAYTNNSS
jgi:hypothetical protein